MTFKTFLSITRAWNSGGDGVNSGTQTRKLEASDRQIRVDYVIAIGRGCHIRLFSLSPQFYASTRMDERDESVEDPSIGTTGITTAF